MSQPASDPIVALRGLPTPPPASGFWDDLLRQLPEAAAAGIDPGRTVADLADRPARRRRGRPVTLTVVLAAAAAVVAVVVTAQVRSSGSPASPADGDAPVVSTVEQLPATTLPRPPAEPAPVVVQRTLAEGTTGDDVRAVQQRLHDLAFDPGPIDGVFGASTTQAVWAFETLVLQTPYSEVTGAVTPETWAVMQGDVSIVPRRTDLTDTHVEIYLPEQALVVFEANAPALVAHISSGALQAPGDDFTKGATYCGEVLLSPGEIGNEAGTEPIVDGRCGNAETPGGTYRFYRAVEGVQETSIGRMLDPVYFNYGIAVHGSPDVPVGPSSHGSIRIDEQLAPIFRSMIVNLGKDTGDQVYVWNGVKEPEAYGPKPGWFDTPDLQWRDAHPSASTSTTAPPATG
jgi:hypothetical protein